VVSSSETVEQKPIEIVFGDGIVVRVPSGVDEAQLVRVLTALAR
jgi:hypothetical protein